jgi:hypothetical protein
MQNRIVVRYADGRILKGHAADFLPTKALFHLTTTDRPGANPVEIRLAEVKAVFFVKDLRGNTNYHERQDFDPAHRPVGHKIRVKFNDGEILVGTTQGYEPERLGFFVIPADPESNNERCFIVSSAVKNVAFV